MPIEYFAGRVSRLLTAHFGLTALRTDCLRKLAKPWFLATPDADGNWGDGRVDEDVNFWHGWAKAGFTLYQANKVRLGHMQWIISWPGKAFAPCHQLMGNYTTNGKHPTVVQDIAAITV